MKTKRQLVWERVQLEEPGMAAVMAEVRRVFGPGPTPTIRLGGAVVWSPALALREWHRVERMR